MVSLDANRMLYVLVVVILVIAAHGLRSQPTKRYWPPKATNYYLKFRIKQEYLPKFSDAAFQNFRSFASKVGSKSLNAPQSAIKTSGAISGDIQSMLINSKVSSDENSNMPNTFLYETEVPDGGENYSFTSIEVDYPHTYTNISGGCMEPLEMDTDAANMTVPSRTINPLSSILAPGSIKTDLESTPSFSASSWSKSSRGVGKSTSNSNTFGKQFSTYANFSSMKEKLHVPSFSSSSASSVEASRNKASTNSGRGDKASTNATVVVSATDFASFNKRLERLEKQAMIPTPKQKSVTDSFVDSLKTDLLELSPKTIEICSTCGFFLTGCVLGASLLDRLWLIGGVIGAYWASHAVYKDSRGGVLARRLGVKIAQLIRDLQEKINGMIIFYNTGKLAIETSKWYEKYDKKYMIEDKMNKMKKLAMNRAADFKGWTKKIESNRYLDTLGDAWTVVTSVPDRAQQWDKQYKITGNLAKFGKGLVGTMQDGFVEILNRGIDGWDGYTDDKRRHRGRRSMFNSNKKSRGRDNLFRVVTSWTNRNDHSRRGYPINPWELPFESLKGSRRRKRRYRY